VCIGGACGTATSPTAVLTWDVTNDCLNGEDVSFRFFDITAGLVWPDNTTAYDIVGGTATQSSLLCLKGDIICFGGDQPTHGNQFGVGIQGNLQCPNCCYACDDVIAQTDIVCN
jgi:hypothetical protein